MKESRMRTGSTEVISRFIKDLKLGEKLLVSAFGESLGPDTEAQDVKILQTLLKQRILVSSAQGYRLNPHLQKLFNSVIDVDRSRYINVNIKARIPSLELVMNSYIDNLQSQNYEYARESLADIEQQAFEIVFEAQGAVRSLANRLQTRFGFVRGLKEKILENESAITTAGLLVENLTAFSFDKMSDFVHRADNNAELYNIVCVHMLGELARCQSSLNSIMIQLREMLALFRRERKRTSLLKAFSEKHYKEPGYHPGDYAVTGPVISDLFKRAQPFIATGHADFRNDFQLEDLCRIAAGLKKAPVETPEGKSIPRAEGFTSLPEVQTENFTPDDTEDDIIAYFRYVVGANAPVSARKYYGEHKVKGALDHWLFAVCAFYEDLSPENRAGFMEPIISYGYMYDESDLDDTLTFLDSASNKDVTSVTSEDISGQNNSSSASTSNTSYIKASGFGNKILTDFALAVKVMP